MQRAKQNFRAAILCCSVQKCCTNKHFISKLPPIYHFHDITAAQLSLDSFKSQRIHHIVTINCRELESTEFVYAPTAVFKQSFMKICKLALKEADTILCELVNILSSSSSSRWHYSPEWALASSTICLQASRFLALSLSIRLHPSFSGPWTRHPAISFLVFLFLLLHTAFRTTSFLGLRCPAFFLYDQAIIFFGI